MEKLEFRKLKMKKKIWEKNKSIYRALGKEDTLILMPK